jgi:hypothetical protein
MQRVGFLEATLFISHLREHDVPGSETMTILLGIRLNEVNQESVAFLDLNVSRVSRVVTHHRNGFLQGIETSLPTFLLKKLSAKGNG